VRECAPGRGHGVQPASCWLASLGPTNETTRRYAGHGRAEHTPTAASSVRVARTSGAATASRVQLGELAIRRGAPSQPRRERAASHLRTRRGGGGAGIRRGMVFPAVWPLSNWGDHRRARRNTQAGVLRIGAPSHASPIRENRNGGTDKKRAPSRTSRASLGAPGAAGEQGGRPERVENQGGSGRASPSPGHDD